MSRFGIVAPLTGQRPSWGSGVARADRRRTHLCRHPGRSTFISDTVSIGFLGLSAGSILYVVIELLAVARKADLKTITTWGIFAGLILGFATDAIITAAGA